LVHGRFEHVEQNVLEVDAHDGSKHWKFTGVGFVSPHISPAL
jgi:hypothetical protein